MKFEIEKIINLCSAEGINSKSKIKEIAEKILIEAELHELYNQYHFADNVRRKSELLEKIFKLHAKIYMINHPMNEMQI